MTKTAAGEGPVERPVGRLEPEREAFERWCSKNGWAESDLADKCHVDAPRGGEYRHQGLQDAWEFWQAGLNWTRDRFRDALWETYKMVDVLRPPGTPGSYVRGEHNGVVAALQTLKENFNRNMP